MPAFPNLGGKTAQQANDILASGGWTGGHAGGGVRYQSGGTHTIVWQDPTVGADVSLDVTVNCFFDSTPSYYNSTDGMIWGS